MSVAIAPHSGTGVQARPPIVLIVDHRETIRRVLALILESEGLQVVSTDATSAAVALTLELQPAAILLDVDEGDEDAQCTLESLKRDPRSAQVPVILLTDSRTMITEASRARAEAILAKPVDLDLLVTRVEHLVSQRAS